MYINTVWLDAYVNNYAFECTNTLYGLGDMLDIPQQNPLKYSFSGIEYIYLLNHTKYTHLS